MTELERAIQHWSQVAAENREALATPVPPAPETPRDALTNRPIAFKAKASVNKYAPHAGGGRTVPHSSDPLPPHPFR